LLAFRADLHVFYIEIVGEHPDGLDVVAGDDVYAGFLVYLHPGGLGAGNHAAPSFNDHPVIIETRALAYIGERALLVVGLVKAYAYHVVFQH